MPDMTTEAARERARGMLDRLPEGPARLAVGIACAIVLTEMIGGYWSSWGNLYDAASRHHWSAPALLPLLMDLPILAYVILGQVAVICLETRALALDAAALLLAAATVWANYAVDGHDDRTWRILHALMAAGWVLGIEALRWFWAKLRRSAAERPDRIPLGRWIADPLGTRSVQWRMWRLGETSWARMSAIEDAAEDAADVVRELERTGGSAPAALSARIAARRLPASVLDAIRAALQYRSGPAGTEAAVRAWVADRMTLPERAAGALAEALRDALPAAPEPQPAAAPEPPAEAHPPAAPERTRQTRPDAHSGAPRKPSARACRDTPLGAFGELAGPWVAVQLEDRPGLSIRAVADDLKVGTPKAKAALEAGREIAGRDARVVVQIGTRQEAGSR